MNTITIDISYILMHYLIPYIALLAAWYYIMTSDYERTYYKSIYMCWASILAFFSTLVYCAIDSLISQIHINITL
jgi:hypothetical protein